MGSALGRLGHKNPKRFPKQDGTSLLEQFTKLESRTSGNERCFGLLASITELIRPSCLHVVKQKEDKKEMHLIKSSDNVSGLLTLEEWILASPCLNCGISAKKVCPSILDEKMYDEYPIARESLSVEKVKNKVGEGDREMGNPSLSRSQSGKAKKKVSFRLPVVADVFILDSKKG